VRPTICLAVAAASAAATGSSAEAASATGLPVALAVSPARISLDAPASRTIQLRNVGAERVVVEVAPKSADRRMPAKRWVTIRPAQFALRAGSRAVLTVRADVRPGIGAGDHEALVLLITRPLQRNRVAVRLRLGIRVRVRMPGRIVRRVELRGLRLRRRSHARLLLVPIANMGNVIEHLTGPRTLALFRRGRVVARLPLHGARELLPGTRTILVARYGGGMHGTVATLVRLRVAGRPRALERRYTLRL